ncbi:MAG: hypothetical protein H6757_00825 [Candidatus Omnitrophica bacterium]|nr:hypothetical protein [Candidatus Omnitrophota bacterium]
MKKNLFSVFFVLFLTVFYQNAQASIFSSVDVDSSGVQEAQKKKDGFIIKRAVDEIKIDGKEKSLRGQTRIAVPFFRLNFVTGDKYRNAVGGRYTSTSTSKVKSSLSGVEPEVFQQVTDEMYTDLISQLKEKGYAVVTNEELSASEKYSDLDKEYPQIKKSVAKVTPTGLSFPGKFKDPSPDISETVDAVVLELDMDIDFLVINRNEARFSLTKDKSHVDVTQGINIMGTATLFSGEKTTTINFQQPVTAQRAFGRVNDETSALSKANDALVFASGWLSPQGLGSKRQTSRKLDVDADPLQYRLAVGDAMVQINRKLAETLQELRGE